MFSEMMNIIKRSFLNEDRIAMRNALKYMVANGCMMYRDLNGRENHDGSK